MKVIGYARWTAWLGRKSRRAWPLWLSLSLSAATQARPAVHISDPREPGLADPVVPSNPFGGHSLATDGENWLAVYSGYLRTQSVATARLIAPDGQPLSAPFVIAYGFNPRAVVFDGNDYLVLGESDTKAAFVRITSAGTTTGEVTFLSDTPQAALTISAAVSAEGHTRAIVCASSACRAFDILDNEIRRRALLPVSRVNQLVYSNDRWLVLAAGSALYEVTMLQLDEGGSPVEGTLKSLGESSEPMLAAPAPDGFALVRPAWPQVELLTIDATGVTTVKGKYGAEGEVVAPKSFVQQGNGYLLLAKHFDPDANEEDLLQHFDAELAPSGDPALLPATSNAILAQGEPEKALMTWVGDTLKSRLIDLSLPLGYGEITYVSVAPQGQRQVLVSPAPEGWLALWATDWQRPWQYALLDDDGALRGKPKNLPNWGVDVVSRGPGGWLASQDECVGAGLDERDEPCQLDLVLIPDAGKPRWLEPIGPLSEPTPIRQRSTFSITGSEHGWLVVWSGLTELHASRLDEAGTVVGDVVLEDGQTSWPAVASAISADGYRVFWGNAATGKISSATVAATGDVTASPAVVVGERAELSELASACSGDDTWLLGEAVCREPACVLDTTTRPAKRGWFQANQAQPQELATDAIGPLVSVAGVALGVISDAHSASFPPIQLGLAEAGAPLEVVHSFEGGVSPALAAKSDGRALLAFLHVSTDEGPPVPRIVTRVITLSPEEQGGAGGADSENAGDAGQGGEPSTGVDGGAGAGAGQAGADSEAKPPVNKPGGGCDCTTAPRSGTRLGLLVPLAWLLRRRRVSHARAKPHA